ncbi:hypothetical protein DL546_002012 [Coniochaeta pulveracea]|uniref:Uncharacterized protein n=1 Tax=Coniochaeta pulveracea TaxID=177199 RepID=A0A420XZN8_9PEZI|nr:hypothetical protein DL546_002012 [Coniochaeta pulveracea]
MFAKLRSHLPTTKTKEISDEDLKKYTGMNKAELQTWSQDRPDVGGWQLAGKINMGTAGGGGIPNSFSYTGRGATARSELKFPPPEKKTEKEKALEEDSD